VKQEVTRKVGFALQPEEEAIRSHLEALQPHLYAPRQLKVGSGKIGELLFRIWWKTCLFFPLSFLFFFHVDKCNLDVLQTRAAASAKVIYAPFLFCQSPQIVFFLPKIFESVLLSLEKRGLSACTV